MGGFQSADSGKWFGLSWPPNHFYLRSVVFCVDVFVSVFVTVFESVFTSLFASGSAYLIYDLLYLQCVILVKHLFQEASSREESKYFTFLSKCCI